MKRIQRKQSSRISHKIMQINGYRKQCYLNYIEDYQLIFLLHQHFYREKVSSLKIEWSYTMFLVDQTENSRMSTPSSLTILREKSVESSRYVWSFSFEFWGKYFSISFSLLMVCTFDYRLLAFLVDDSFNM